MYFDQYLNEYSSNWYELFLNVFANENGILYNQAEFCTL